MLVWRLGPFALAALTLASSSRLADSIRPAHSIGSFPSKAEALQRLGLSVGHGSSSEAAHAPRRWRDEAGAQSRAWLSPQQRQEGAEAADALLQQRHVLGALTTTSVTTEATMQLAETMTTTDGDEAEFYKRYGSTSCPCIGFDRLQGETLVDLGDGMRANYPSDFGATCSAWDDGRHPECTQGPKTGEVADWCKQPWCYVDVCDCNPAMSPEICSYMPHATYLAKPLHRSYLTCISVEQSAMAAASSTTISSSGDERLLAACDLSAVDGSSNTAEKMTVDEESSPTLDIGASACRCIGFAHREGHIRVPIKGEFVDFPAELGGSCKAWDLGYHPACRPQAGGEPLPDWCTQAWCFVTPLHCTLDVAPEVSLYVPQVNFRGEPVYYSYATCGRERVIEDVSAMAAENQLDENSPEEQDQQPDDTEACLVQKTKKDCLALKGCKWKRFPKKHCSLAAARGGSVLLQLLLVVLATSRSWSM